jgi:putative toxin-antitoxin system antitoxin component (TIGR02293 family)
MAQTSGQMAQTAKRSPVGVRGASEIGGVVGVLGGPKALGGRARSADDLAALVREGLPFVALATVMQDYDLSRDAACSILHVSRRNFLRRKEQRRLAPDESDRLVRLARVLAHANRVFEAPRESAEWFRTPNVALGKQQPLDLLDTDLGVQQVDEVLGRIEHGIVG